MKTLTKRLITPRYRKFRGVKKQRLKLKRKLKLNKKVNLRRKAKQFTWPAKYIYIGITPKMELYQNQSGFTKDGTNK